MTGREITKRRLTGATLIGAFEACMFLVGGAVSSVYGAGFGSILIFVVNALAYLCYGGA